MYRHMSAGKPSGVPAAHRSAFAVFAVAGWLSATWATRIPSIKEELGLSAGELAVAILGLEAGAVAGLPGGAAIVGRAGSRRALRGAFPAFALALVAVGLAPGLGFLAAALAAMAFANSVVDVALNAQGIELERRAGRPLLSRLHAGHPLGLVGGGLAGTAAAAAGLSVAAHLAATGRLAGDGDGGRRPALARPSRRVLLLGALAFCAFALDGAASNWSAVHLRTEHGAPAGLAAAAFTAFALAMAAGRLAGDRLLVRLGRLRLVRLCAAVAVAGAALVVIAPGAGVALAAWALLGLGLAAVAPAVLGAAPGSGRESPAVAIAAVTTIGYLGSFTGPPVVGALAE